MFSPVAGGLRNHVPAQYMFSPGSRVFSGPPSAHIRGGQPAVHVPDTYLSSVYCSSAAQAKAYRKIQGQLAFRNHVEQVKVELQQLGDCEFPTANIFVRLTPAELSLRPAIKHPVELSMGSAGVTSLAGTGYDSFAAADEEAAAAKLSCLVGDRSNSIFEADISLKLGSGFLKDRMQSVDDGPDMGSVVLPLPPAGPEKVEKQLRFAEKATVLVFEEADLPETPRQMMDAPPDFAPTPPRNRNHRAFESGQFWQGPQGVTMMAAPPQVVLQPSMSYSNSVSPSVAQCELQKMSLNKGAALQPWLQFAPPNMELTTYLISSGLAPNHAGALRFAVDNNPMGMASPPPQTGGVSHQVRSNDLLGGPAAHSSAYPAKRVSPVSMLESQLLLGDDLDGMQTKRKRKERNKTGSNHRRKSSSRSPPKESDGGGGGFIHAVSLMDDSQPPFNVTSAAGSGSISQSLANPHSSGSGGVSLLPQSAFHNRTSTPIVLQKSGPHSGGMGGQGDLTAISPVRTNGQGVGYVRCVSAPLKSVTNTLMPVSQWTTTTTSPYESNYPGTPLATSVVRTDGSKESNISFGMRRL